MTNEYGAARGHSAHRSWVMACDVAIGDHRLMGAEEDMDLDAEARALARLRATASPATSRMAESECRKCHRRTAHEITSTGSHCLRCRELDGEAAKLIEARQRADEIRQRANAPDNPLVRAEIAANKKKHRWENLLMLVIALGVGIAVLVAGDGDPVKGFIRIWIAIAKG